MSSRRIAAVLLVVAAIAAILLPFVSATLLTIGIGGIAFSAGIGQLLRLGAESTSQGKLFRVLSALLYIGGAVFILVDPIDSEISLTLFAGVLLLVEGVMELASGATTPGAAAGLAVVDGVVTSILGLLLVLEWPTDSLWALGTLFGVALFLSALNLFQTASDQPGV
ncbi:HdeD family acid-resistance protein [Synechococcus sp. A10-1-5-9]|uniref:HdeD family acid-resistance protein n=1 Tax=Synechococcus sp. A10-1-5-9 TaxID=3392295 RepID=UPI0039ED20B0